MNLNEIKIQNKDKMPLLFVGHGTPMNAIERNSFTDEWEKIGKVLPKPDSILCISAHWETKGTYFTAMEKPETIHDFGGFPRELYEVQYPAPGNYSLASESSELIKGSGLDMEWGLDHGCWSVLKRMYPKADVPVVQMSLDYSKDAKYHFEIAKKLMPLRYKKVLIIGSGNIVHNLRLVDWNQGIGSGYDWAREANEKLKSLIMNNDYESLINYRSLGKEISLAIPTPEHYLPLLYVLALKDENEKVEFFNDKTEYGSLAMTSVIII